jgi:hypothetical protein
MNSLLDKRLSRLEARGPTKLDQLTDAELEALAVRLRSSNADDEELPALIADCLGCEERRASSIISELLASS